MTNAGGEEGKRKPSFTVGGLQTGAGTMEIPCLPPWLLFTVGSPHKWGSVKLTWANILSGLLQFQYLYTVGFTPIQWTGTRQCVP